MIIYIHTNSDNSGFQKLSEKLETELKIRDGEDHAFYAQLNTIDSIKYAIVAYENEVPVACGATREYDADSMEVKRMFVMPNRRGRGIASEILKQLEQWALELNYKKCLLETGLNQPEAIALYKKNGYCVIPNFGKYKNSANSICFEKVLNT